MLDWIVEEVAVLRFESASRSLTKTGQNNKSNRQVVIPGGFVWFLLSIKRSRINGQVNSERQDSIFEHGEEEGQLGRPIVQKAVITCTKLVHPTFELRKVEVVIQITEKGVIVEYRAAVKQI